MGKKNSKNNFPHLENAPIYEAVIDIRLALDQEIDVSNFIGDATKKIRSTYNKIQDHWEFKGGVEIKNEQVSQNIQRKKQGFFFRHKNEQQMVQFRYNGFTFNKLHPYTNWDSILKETKKLWNVYKRIVGGYKVTRVAVRYINHIDLSLPIRNLSDYFLTHPSTASREITEMKAFSCRSTLTYPGFGCQVNVIHSSQQAPKKEEIRMVYDIDAFKIIPEDHSLQEQEIWDIFTKLRYIKNDIFFSNLTKKTLKRYR